MTKEEFEILHNICRTEWLKLNETGLTNHTELTMPFLCHCPACEIASNCLGLHDLSEGLYRCKFCPITYWRNTEATLSCTFDTKSYARWTNVAGDIDYILNEGDSEDDVSDLREELKVCAEQIAGLEWSWIEEYKDVQLTERVKQAIRNFKSS